MGFKSLIAKQVQGAMKILGTDQDGLATAQTYVSVDQTGTIYDPITRTSTQATTTHLNIPMALVRFKIEEMDEKVRPASDRRALIAALDLPGVIPNEQDRILLADGGVHVVQRILSDPASALHILHVRYSEPA